MAPGKAKTSPPRPITCSSTDTELDALEAAGGLVGSQGRHSQHQEWREYTVNLQALVGALQFQRPEETHSQVQETDPPETGNYFITTR